MPRPSAIEKVNGIANAVMTAGKYSVMSSQSISIKDLIIRNATKSRAADVAKLGMLWTRGAKARHKMKKRPTVIAASPVLPPLSTPAADSI